MVATPSMPGRRTSSRHQAGAALEAPIGGQALLAAARLDAADAESRQEPAQEAADVGAVVHDEGLRWPVGLFSAVGHGGGLADGVGGYVDSAEA